MEHAQWHRHTTRYQLASAGSTPLYLVICGLLAEVSSCTASILASAKCRSAQLPTCITLYEVNARSCLFHVVTDSPPRRNHDFSIPFEGSQQPPQPRNDELTSSPKAMTVQCLLWSSASCWCREPIRFDPLSPRLVRVAI
jgi:hypothetical protein